MPLGAAGSFESEASEKVRFSLLHFGFLLPGLWALPVLAQPLTIQPGFDGQQAIDRYDELVLTLNRPIEPHEGRLAVFLGATDLTALFEYDGVSLRYVPELIPLPSGESEVVVYLVADGEPWTQLIRNPIHIRLPGGFDTADVDPSLTLNNKGQLAESTFPAPPQSADHRIYQDFSGQLDVRGEVLHTGWDIAAQGQVVGVSYQNEALRFGELQADAPRIDLAGYNVRLQRRNWRIQAGNVAHGQHRHVSNQFSSRGLEAGLAINGRVDLAVAAMNGTRIVGWSNPIGLNEPDHRILSGTLGLEILKRRPGGFRVEGTYVDGSVQPRTGFNQGGIADAEKSRGGGVRLVAGTTGRRLRLEMGYGGSRYTNPFDPTLAQGSALTPVQEETRYAHYVEATAGILQNVMLSPRLPVNVQLAYRRARVDPLYRTVTAYVQGDHLHNAAELQASLGPVGLQLSHSRGEDNLDEIPSILKTRTRQDALNLSLPLRTLVSPQKISPLLPIVTYSYNQTRQIGVDLPSNGGFSPTHVPNQMNRIHNAGLVWQGSRWSAGYRFSSAFQDNRQEGREEADFLNRTGTLSFTFDPSSLLSLGVDVGLDRSENRAADRVDRTRRVGIRTTLRPMQPLVFSASVSPTSTRSDAAQSGNVNLAFEGSYSFQTGSRLRWPARGQAFVRFARQALHYRDPLFGIDTENRTWSVNSGISLTLF